MRPDYGGGAVIRAASITLAPGCRLTATRRDQRRRGPCDRGGAAALMTLVQLVAAEVGPKTTGQYALAQSRLPRNREAAGPIRASATGAATIAIPVLVVIRPTGLDAPEEVPDR